MAKRYYWLKLNENFFEREEIKVIENMPNGKDYIIFYLKLLLKSISTEGKLKFRNIIPYTPEMLSAITGTDIDTVRVATDLFVKLGLMEAWDDGTLFMIETQNMIGSETDSARRVRKYRQGKALNEPPKTESKTNTERQRKYRAKQACREVQHVPFIEDYTDNKRYNGNYYIVLKRDKFKCSICGSAENLCVHHIDGYDETKPQNNEESKLITLCRKCHSSIHAGREIPKHVLENIDYFHKNSNGNEICNADVTTCNKMKQTSNTDIDIDKELDTDKDIDIDTTTIKKPATAPHEEIVNLYNSICISFNPVKRITDKRKGNINARCRENNNNIEIFRAVFTKVQNSTFLKGGWNTGGKADFDWILKPTNFVKVLEGKYDDKDDKDKPYSNNKNLSKLEQMYRQALAEEEDE